MTLYELHAKDVIQNKTGEKLGRIDDMVFSADTAQIEKAVLRGRPRCCGLFGRGPDLEIPWGDVKTIGTDVLIVDTELPPEERSRPRW